ncbi:arsenate reductase (glutaredoxin) [Piscinibacter koreensis]|uniref:Arsenate reductase n=1 Tax=Piscinibacter koreensis TaxID=2742824 RepID=A0A7Y6NLB1_9BURK|nr:arsenate reductase (glutaredoxin) [Schlegelella koreensis]NUZ05189.1 arsenate reductase (glutaredoxin) [Schlegelella koreensis]
MSDTVIYHNPACGTSRSVLTALRAAGIEPSIVQYLKTPPSKQKLRELAGAAGIPVRRLLREKEPIYNELGLADANLTDDKLLDAMQQHPVLINRPIVETPLGTRLCRPADRLNEILPR